MPNTTGHQHINPIEQEIWKRHGRQQKLPARYARFFRALGHKIQPHRLERKLSQEDMIGYGFSVRHWQMIEAGRPSTLWTLLRVCDAFGIPPEQLVAGLAHHLRRRKGDPADQAEMHGTD